MAGDDRKDDRKGRWPGLDLGGGGAGSGNGSRRWRAPTWILLALLFGMIFLFQALLTPRPTVTPLSEFTEAVANDRIQGTVVVGDTEVSGEWLKDGQKADFRATLPPGFDPAPLLKLMDDNGVQYEGRQPGAFGAIISFVGSLLVMVVILGLVYFFLFRRVGGGAQGALNLGKNKVKIYDRKEMKTSFADVAGLDEAMDELREVVDYLSNPKKYQRLGGRIPKGVLLLGPPGCGKTLLARAVAGEANVPFFFMSGSEFVEMFVGLGAARVRELFQQAKEKAPALVFLDELDTIGKGRMGGIGGNLGGHDEREQTLNQLLVEMDGFDASKGVIIMAATNRPDVLDPALVRPGRFDRQVVVDRPDLLGREAILRVHARGVALDKTVDLKVLASRTPGFTGADLANVVNEAALLAARREKNAVMMAELEEAIDRGVAGLERKSRVMSVKEREIVAKHEMGHALVALVVPNADPLHRVSIIPRGTAALGMTMQRPLEDRYLLTEPELDDRLTILLGGRTAEEICFDQVSTGAQNDLEKATDVARAMVTEYGMSPKLGPLSFGHDGFRTAEGRPLFPGERPEVSNATAQLVDEEVSRLVNSAHERAQGILEERRDLLDRLSQLLMAWEVIEGAELRNYVEGKIPIPDPATVVSNGPSASNPPVGEPSSDVADRPDLPGASAGG